MTSITLTVTGAKARASVSGPLTSGMVGIPVTIEYDDSWENLTKNLVCRCGKWGPEKGETRIIRDIGESATVAQEVMKPNMHLYLGIEGYSMDGKMVVPTTWADCGPILLGATAGDAPSANPKLPIWAQLQREIRQIKDQIVTEEQIAASVAAYLEENPIEVPEAPQNPALNAVQVTSLDGMFKVCAFIKDDVSAEYNAFYAAFGIEGGGEEEPDEPVNPEVTLTSISATYSGGDVTVGTAVTDLTGVAVTAHYSDGSQQNVIGYTLSGTIAEGSNTVTVTYQSKTATFTVTGVAESGGEETTTPFGVAWTEGIILSKGNEVENATWVTSDYVDVTGKSEIKIYNDSGKLFTFQGHFYNADKICPDTAAGSEWGINKQYIQGSAAYPSPLTIPIKDGAAYVRLSTSIQSGSATAGYVHYTELTYELV